MIAVNGAYLSEEAEQVRLLRIANGRRIYALTQERQRYLQRARSVVYNEVPLKVAAMLKQKIERLQTNNAALEQQAKRFRLQAEPLFG